ncbi:MAG: nuclear transport factor 2 family protein [Desulfarculus sp.]|nr:nuclear transport factor 2 family protein [Desulfarculus sp.]
MAKALGYIGLLLLTLAVPALAAPAPKAAPAAAPSPAQAEAEITALLQGATGALARKDMHHLTSLLDNQAEVEVRGLGLNRRTVGRQRVRALYGPELAAAEAPRVDFRGVQVQAQGTRARVEALLTAYVVPQLPEGLDLELLRQQRVPVPGRLSAILERQGSRWVFQRMLLVFPGGAR